MTKLLKFLKPYWYLVLLAPTLMIIEVISDLMLPKLLSNIVDNGILGGDFQLILSSGITMLIIAAIGGLGGFGSAAFGSASAQCFANDLRNASYKKAMSLSLQQTDKFTTGSLITRLTNDITSVSDLVAMSLRMFVRVAMQFVGGIYMCLTLSVNFGIVLAIALPILIVLIYIMIKKSGPLFSKVQSKLDRVNNIVGENVSGARVVKAYIREDFESKRFDLANKDLMDTIFKVQKLLTLIIPGMTILMGVSIILVIYIGGLSIDSGNLQVGQVMAGVTYVTHIIMSVMTTGMLFQVLSRALASAKRINEVLETEPAIIGGDKDMPSLYNCIEFKDASFKYPNVSENRVLENINLKIKKGETVAILGATGSGKTSLVNLIPRFYDLSDGALLFDGYNIKDFTLESIREKIAIVLQKSELFTGTIAENIAWGKENATLEEIRAAAKIAQADDFICEFADGYNTVIGEKGSTLSGGQKQRISIARAVLKNPSVLIFDDSTSALDFKTEAKLHKALRENLKDTTIIIVAQRVASVMSSDKIAILENHTITDIGTHSYLIENSEAYKDIYNSQIQKGESI